MEKGSYQIILGSASPRRTELLKQIGLDHKIIVSDCEEVITSSIPYEVVMELSRQKAEAVFQKYTKEHPNEKIIVIGADTVVAANDRILGKPKDEEDAVCMIKMLQDHVHQVYTGVTIIQSDGKEERKNCFYECSDVEVYPMTDDEIKAYVATKEPMDKAGAYGIQGAFAAYIKGIKGDYNNIVGLPVARIYQELKVMKDETDI